MREQPRVVVQTDLGFLGPGLLELFCADGRQLVRVPDFTRQLCSDEVGLEAAAEEGVPLLAVLGLPLEATVLFPERLELGVGEVSAGLGVS